LALVSAVTYRAATLDDAPLASDVMSTASPLFLLDPVMTRFRWENPRLGYTYTRFLAYRDGRAIAVIGSVHAPWDKVPERHCEVEVWLDRSLHERSLIDELYAWIEREAIDQGARLLLTFCGEDEPEILAALKGRGYSRERAERMWELDLRTHGAALVENAAQARAHMQSEGIRLLTVADWHDPAALHKLFELNEQTVQDVPHSLPIVREQFEDFDKRVHAPDRRSDRWWIAVDGERPVAMSFLKFPPVRGAVWTGYTCTDRQYRGRGIARAVKLQTLAQAVELGVPLVRTDNDSENAPMLHINETLGYVRVPGFVEHHKRVETQGA
jgi:RimJ/RimL family protein N-acetyltransferase